MEERKNTEDPVAFVQREYLPDLFDVRGDIVVSGARAQDLIRSRVIQVDHGLTRQQRSRIDESARHTWWQENSGHFLIPPEWPEPPRQQDRTDQCWAESQPGHARIRHRKAEPVAPRGLYDRLLERLHPCFAVRKRFAFEFLYGLPHFERRRSGRHRPAEADGDPMGPMRHFKKELLPLETEYATPHAVEVYRDDRSIDALHDPLESAPERQQVSNPGDLSLRDDADNTASLNRFARLSQC